MRNWTTYGAAIALTALIACSDDDDNNNNNNTPQGQFANGVLVINEGPFMSGSGSISFISGDGSRVEQEVFANANGFPSGNVLNSAAISGDRVLLVANGSGRVASARLSDLVSQASVSSIASPRHVVDAGQGLIAVTDWSSDQVFLLDRDDLSTVAAHPTGSGPEEMIVHNNLLYVLNSGGFDRDSTATVIDLTQQEIAYQIPLGDIPNSAVEVNGQIWVLCSGYADFTDPSNDTEGRLVRIDPSTMNVAEEHIIPLSIGHPGDLVFDDENQLFCFLANGYGGAIMQSPLSDPGTISARKGGTYYALGYDAARGRVVAGNALTFAEPGWMVRLPNGTAAIDSFRVGIIPTDFVFP